MKRHKSQKIVLVLAALIIAAGIGGGVYRNLKQSQQYKLIYIPKIVDETNDFWTSLIAGAEMAASEYNATLEVVAADSEEDYQRQNELIEEAIKKAPDAILVSPCSYTKSTEVLKKVSQQGIKLVLIDSIADEKIEDLVVSTDNYEAGEKLGQFASSLIKKGDQIGIVGHVEGTSTAIDREAGVRAGLGEKAVGVQEVVFCNSRFVKAYDLTKEMIAKYPDLTMLVGLNEYAAVGAARAIADADLKGKIKVVGFDSSIEEIQLMEAGVFQGIVIQKPFNMGYLGVEQTIKLLRGEKAEHNLDSGSALITMENLYTEENQKLLFPFVDKKKRE